jgi:hypothetical protein
MRSWAAKAPMLSAYALARGYLRCIHRRTLFDLAEPPIDL